MSPVYKLQFAEMCYFGNAQYNVLVEGDVMILGNF